MKDRFKFRFWNTLRNEYENTYSLESCIFLDYVIPEQCTGLKDKNGKLIYEGDIVKDDIGMIAPVCFDEVNALFYIDSYIGVYIYPFAHFYHYDSEEELEVIGNIHENKDLIKVGGK